MSDYSPSERLFIGLQHLIPQHTLSRLLGRAADSRIEWLKNTLITRFIRAFDVDMSEAAEPDATRYASFNDFFTRALKPNARPLAQHGLCCPADGAISQIGTIEHDTLLQAKGIHYSLQALLGETGDRAEDFIGGNFATIYLSPRDYHRVHIPLTGTLKCMTYVPGKLFSVNTTTAQHVPNLFARNERVIAYFDTEIGPMAVILVGAVIVASIETAWAGLVTPPKRTLSTVHYGNTDEAKLSFVRGAEIGRFRLGSTAIVLTPPNTVEWLANLRPGQAVKMGQALGTFTQ